MKLSCGCIPDASGYGYCGECTAALYRKIWRKMSWKEKKYDREVSPSESRYLDEITYSCNCHIHPPCTFCISKSEEECDEQ